MVRDLPDTTKLNGPLSHKGKSSLMITLYTVRLSSSPSRVLHPLSRRVTWKD
jgi:hypothetical protein